LREDAEFWAHRQLPDLSGILWLFALLSCCFVAMPFSTSEEKTMPETVQEYTSRLLSYADGKDPLRLQQAAPKKLAQLLKGKTKTRLMRKPGPDKWSIAEIVAHLADAEIAIAWRLRQVLSNNAIPIQAYDQDAWAKTLNYARRDPRQSLAHYTSLREANLVLLKSVPRKLWENYGIHQERGNESASHVVRLVAGHDINHLRQVEAILKGKR
jgi:DinB superfamily